MTTYKYKSNFEKVVMCILVNEYRKQNYTIKQISEASKLTISQVKNLLTF